MQEEELYKPADGQEMEDPPFVTAEISWTLNHTEPAPSQLETSTPAGAFAM